MTIPKSTGWKSAPMSNHERMEALRLEAEIETLINEADPRGRDLIRRMVKVREAALDLHGQNDFVKKSESVQFAREMAKGMRDDPERWFGEMPRQN